MPQDNVNRISLANLYPDERSTTTAEQGSEQNPANTNDPTDSASPHPIEQTFASSLRDNPVYGWLGLLILLLAGFWIATRFSGGKPAANARLSIFNLIAIPTLAIVGSSIAKVGVQALANRGYKLPFGMGTVILAA